MIERIGDGEGERSTGTAETILLATISPVQLVHSTRYYFFYLHAYIDSEVTIPGCPAAATPPSYLKNAEKEMLRWQQLGQLVTDLHLVIDMACHYHPASSIPIVDFSSILQGALPYPDKDSSLDESHP